MSRVRVRVRVRVIYNYAIITKHVLRAFHPWPFQRRVTGTPNSPKLMLRVRVIGGGYFLRFHTPFSMVGLAR